MFEFVLGLFAAPFIAYFIYAYGRIGKGILKDVFNNQKNSLAHRAMIVVLAILISLIPMLLVIPFLSKPAIIAGLIIGIFFVFIFTRKSRHQE